MTAAIPSSLVTLYDDIQKQFGKQFGMIDTIDTNMAAEIAKKILIHEDPSHNFRAEKKSLISDFFSAVRKWFVKTPKEGYDFQALLTHLQDTYKNIATLTPDESKKIVALTTILNAVVNHVNEQKKLTLQTIQWPLKEARLESAKAVPLPQSSTLSTAPIARALPATPIARALPAAPKISDSKDVIDALKPLTSEAGIDFVLGALANTSMEWNPKEHPDLARVVIKGPSKALFGISPQITIVDLCQKIQEIRKSAAPDLDALDELVGAITSHTEFNDLKKSLHNPEYASFLQLVQRAESGPLTSLEKKFYAKAPIKLELGKTKTTILPFQEVTRLSRIMKQFSTLETRVEAATKILDNKQLAHIFKQLKIQLPLTLGDANNFTELSEKLNALVSKIETIEKLSKQQERFSQIKKNAASLNFGALLPYAAKILDEINKRSFTKDLFAKSDNLPFTDLKSFAVWNEEQNKLYDQYEKAVTALTELQTLLKASGVSSKQLGDQNTFIKHVVGDTKMWDKLVQDAFHGQRSEINRADFDSYLREDLDPKVHTNGVWALFFYTQDALMEKNSLDLQVHALDLYVEALCSLVDGAKNAFSFYGNVKQNLQGLKGKAKPEDQKIFQIDKSLKTSLRTMRDAPKLRLSIGRTDEELTKLQQAFPTRLSTMHTAAIAQARLDATSDGGGASQATLLDAMKKKF